MAESSIALPPAIGREYPQQNVKTPGPRGFCVELPTERDALKVAQRIADKRAEGRHKARNITVTYEHDKVPMPSKH